MRSQMSIHRTYTLGCARHSIGSNSPPLARFDKFSCMVAQMPAITSAIKNSIRMSRICKKALPRPCAGGAGGICAVESGLFFIFYPLFKGQKCLVGILFQLLGERFKGGKGHFIAEAPHEMEGQGLIVEIAVETNQMRFDGDV